ncbi:NAD-dependent epimerase/dehydratase family protein [Bacillus sp. HMF5848]|uniref:NAD-dependent epimerase/dehydratase family protein n=1 Tax=Bacillus sp. HMF5848 TaxID=2495421 RepID=UPI000F7A2CBE|nr:NAD-dependent epimerase/dehydratase family protein [Bacillus sp. HMF5848]RSK26650.1 NAD-dependent epimerase/dehydratase family protein [Bacillus sp. HMF5848]
MKTALVFGGTRFFGKDLVEKLVKEGVKVTVATRQNSTLPFTSEQIETIKVDRFNKDSILEVVKGREWDVVFDQICYNGEQAAITVDALKGKIKRYVFTSTLSVYGYGNHLLESAFDPYTYDLKAIKPGSELTYQQGKQQAEAVFFQQASFPVVAMRIPIVLGPDDYTERLQLHIDKIKNEQPIGFPNIEADMNFIHQEEAGNFLVWCGFQDFTGPINACANGSLRLKELISMIEHVTDKKAILPEDFSGDIHSPYGIENNWTMSTKKAQKLGYNFSNLTDWLPNLIRKQAK